jgi:hypothetical protein
MDRKVYIFMINLFYILSKIIIGGMSYFPQRRPEFEPGSGKWDLWWTKSFSFPCQSSFHQILHHHNHPVQVKQAIQWPTCRV